MVYCMILWICRETDMTKQQKISPQNISGKSYLGNIIIDHNNVENN